VHSSSPRGRRAPALNGPNTSAPNKHFTCVQVDIHHSVAATLHGHTPFLCSHFTSGHAPFCCSHFARTYTIPLQPLYKWTCTILLQPATLHGHTPFCCSHFTSGHTPFCCSHFTSGHTPFCCSHFARTYTILLQPLYTDIHHLFAATLHGHTPFVCSHFTRTYTIPLQPL